MPSRRPTEGEYLPDAGPPSLIPADARPRHFVWWVILAALATWSYMASWAPNASAILGFFPGRFLAWTTLLFLFGLGVAGAAYLVGSEPARWDRAYGVAAVSLILVQSWSSQFLANVGVPTQWLMFALLSAIVLPLTFRLVPAFSWSRAMFGVLTVFLVGVPYLTTIDFALSQLLADRPEVDRGTVAATMSTPYPDVLVLVLDEYGSGEVLRDEFQHDNSGFEAELQSLGIEVVPHATATYTSTDLSVGGLLNGRYPVIGASDDATYSEIHEIHSGNNSLFSSLEPLGYETHLFDNAWTFTQCARSVDVCHSGGLNELDDLVVNRTPLPGFFTDLRVDPWVRGSVDQLQDAKDVVRGGSASPRLIYLHALIPHAPMHLDSECETFTPGVGGVNSVEDSAVTRNAYVEQVKCVNQLVLDLVRTLPADSIVFIAGDHGPRWAGADPAVAPDASPSDIVTRIGILTAFRFPDRCEAIPPGASLMVSTAKLFECLGIPYRGDPDRDPAQSPRFFSHVLREGGVYDITDITKFVTGD